MSLKSGSYVLVNGERVLRHKTQPAGQQKRAEAGPDRASKTLDINRPPGIRPAVTAKPPTQKRHQATADAGTSSTPTDAGSN
jgi:hypothetical protein